MADNNGIELVDTSTQKQLVEQDTGLVEEVRMLRQHMVDMYQAWMTGKAPPPPLPSFLDATLTQAPVIVPNDPPYSPDFPIYHSFPNLLSSSIVRPPTTFPKNSPPDVFEPRQREVSAGIQPQHRPHEHLRIPDNPLRCYFSPQNLQSHTSPSHHSIHNAPPYALHPQDSHWPAPHPLMFYPPPHACQPPTRKRFQPRPEYKMKRQQQREKSFTPIEKSYASLFQKLRQLDMLKLIQIKIPNPLSKNFDFSQRCAYCYNAPGHSIEKCWHLKRAV
nr:extensin-3-like [Nicotiana tomentosiformis]